MANCNGMNISGGYDNNVIKETIVKLMKIAVLAFVAMPAWSQAAIIPLSATLDGAQEVPANTSPGTGVGSITYDDATNQLNWQITFSGLTAGATGAHFHGPAAPGVNGGVQLAIPLGLFAGQTAGNVSGTATITETQEGQLLAELWYINIHTSAFPGGEIRGQVLDAAPVPVPAAAWLFGSGLLGLAALVRRKA